MTIKANKETTNSKDKASTQLDAAESKEANPANVAQQERISLTPEQTQLLVMRQLNQVNAKKDELTIAIKQLGDLATQLSNICAQQNKVIEQLKSEK